ncbi:unnamed protein product [Auanema sp. JU1783]|nr:unnamed protein product [Auanema sp. JU1783]
MTSKMLILISWSAVILITSACTPTTSDTPVEETRRRRDVSGSETSLVSVTIVSTQPWNPVTNDANLSSVRQLIQSFELQHGIHYDTDRLQHETRNIGGKLAVHYQLNENCEKVNAFVEEIRKAYSNHIQYGLVVCPHQPLSVF